MFTNPLNRKYQTGGSAPTDDQKKDMQGFVTRIKSNIEGFKDKSEQEIAKSLSDMAKSDEGKKSVQDLYSRYQKSKKQKSKFADGGKFQDFICKHGRGGNVDCGCGGMVIRGEDGMQTPRNRYSGWQKQARRWVTLPDGSTQAIEVIVSPDGQTGIQRIITDRSQMQDRGSMAVRDTVYGGGAYDNGRVLIDASQPMIPQEIRDLNDYLDSKPQSKEDGGIVMGRDGLSRKQTRRLSALNKGYDRGQFQLAMANADAALRGNTDLRGRDLRKAKRIIVSGITPMERTITMESSPAELEISLPTAETISNLNPNLELPVREVAIPSPTPIPTRTKEPSRAAQALDNAVQYFSTNAPSTIGAVNYDGYRNFGQNLKDMWNHFTGLFKKEDGGVIEKHQDANGKINISNVTPVGKVTQIRFPKILFGPGHNTVSFKSDDGLVHTWTRYDNGIYSYRPSPSNVTKIYSPKTKETKEVRDGLKHTTITYPIDSTITRKVDALIDDNTKWWE